MPSIRDQILSAVTNTLNAQGAPCKFWRCRQDEFQLTELPAGNFFPEQENGVIDAGEAEEVLTINVACIVTTAQDPVDSAADPLIVWAQNAIMGNANMGGLAVYTERKGIKWYMEQKGVEQCGAVLTFDIHFRTALTDCTSNQS